jgi:hypothetical protein
LYQIVPNGQGICDVAADLFVSPVPQLINDLKAEVKNKSSAMFVLPEPRRGFAKC